MSARIFYQEDCNLSLLDGKTIAIIDIGRRCAFGQWHRSHQ